MSIDRNIVSRQGFESWANNVIVNLIEDNALRVGSYEDRDCQFYIELGDDNNYLITVRAHVMTMGWQVYETSVPKTNL